MFRASFLICIALLTTAVSNGFQPPVVDVVAVSVTEAANADGIDNKNLSEWYSIYHGSELYGTKFNFDNVNDFGIIFAKQRKIRDILLPDKTKTLGITINKIFKKYEDLPFDDNSKNQFIEDCASVSKGLKAAIN